VDKSPHRGWIVLESERPAIWPVPPWQTFRPGSLPWDEEPLFEPQSLPPESDRAGWIAAELAKAEDRLWRRRGIANSDRRQICCLKRHFDAAEDLVERNGRSIIRIERYIDECRRRLRAAAS
jgi:hypothetical protein